jgi:hypothetical protein
MKKLLRKPLAARITGVGFHQHRPRSSADEQAPTSSAGRA